MWGAQSRTPFGAPVGQRGGHRSTCRTHTHPFQGPHDQGHRSSPGRAGPRWPFPSCCRPGKPGVTRARLRVYVSSEEHVVCPARPSSSRGCARGLEGIGGSCVLAGQTEARAPDVRSRRLGPEQPYLACSAEARRSVRGTAPWLALCPACSHLGQREGVEPAGHCPSPAGPPPPECTGFTLPRSPPPARGGIGGDRPRSGHGTQVSSCPRCQGRGQTPHGAGPGWWRTGHTALPTEPPAATPATLQDPVETLGNAVSTGPTFTVPLSYDPRGCHGRKEPPASPATQAGPRSWTCRAPSPNGARPRMEPAQPQQVTLSSPKLLPPGPGARPLPWPLAPLLASHPMGRACAGQQG